MATGPGAVPPPPGETSDIDNPKDVLHTINIAIMIVVLCLTTPLFVLRVYVRSIVLRNVGKEECKSQLAMVRYFEAVSFYLLKPFYNRELRRCICMVNLQLPPSLRLTY